MKANAMEQLVGHRVVSEVRFKDGRVESDVQVRELSIEEYPAYSEVMNVERKAIELFCGKPEGWAVGLTAQSHQELITAGEEMNLPFFASWRARQEERLKRTDPERYALIQEQTKALMDQLRAEQVKAMTDPAAPALEPSSSGSPKSPSSAT